MTLPKKALQYGQLKFTVGSTVPTSGHEVAKATFVDVDGKEKTGFYKPLSDSYPRVLALYAVAAGVAVRNSLGDCAAEDRLVYNKEGEICGTISVALRKYKPMVGSGATLPSNASEKEEVCPSYNTLLARNVAKWLVPAHRHKDDDRHPGNSDLDVILDWDMMWYHITHIIKGPRMADGITKEHPETALNLKSTDLDNFPIIDGRTHWPANAMPGNLNYAKRHQCYEEFRQLASNPSIDLNDGNGPVSFQEQYFSAILHELVTYEPSTLKERLKEYFGEEKLDYLSLPNAKSELLSKTFPKLFNTDTDRQPFVDHILAVMQREYDEFYRNAVFYKGIEKNIMGVPVISFHDFLHNRPSAFKKSLLWATQENELMEQNWKKYKQKTDSGNEAAGIPDYYALPEAARYDLKKMHARYHQIWRDAHALYFKSILIKIDELRDSLSTELSKKPSLESKSYEPKAMDDITKSIQIFDTEMDLPKLDCAEDNPLAKAYMQLTQFRESLNKYKDNYFNLESWELTDEANMQFCMNITKCGMSFETQILQSLGQTPRATKWSEIMKQIWSFSSSFSFCRHLIENDTPLGSKDKYEYHKLVMRNHTDREVVSATMKALFDWAKNIPRDMLDGYIEETIKHYQPSKLNVLANRNRAPHVLTYIKENRTKSGDDILGYILAAGGTETNSLNTLLIKYLVPHMLEHQIGQSDVNLSSVLRAVQKQEFNTKTYAEEAQNYALKDKRFTHIYSAWASEQFNISMYKWAATVDPKDFKMIIEEVLAGYKGYTLNFLSQRSRTPEVQGYLKDKANSNGMILSKIFCAGKKDSTLSKDLFIKVVEKMKSASRGVEAIVHNIANEEISDHIYKSLQDYANKKNYDKASTTVISY